MIAELVPPEHDAQALATGLVVLLDGDVFLSWFDTSERRSEERRLAVESYLALLPRRPQTAR